MMENTHPYKNRPQTKSAESLSLSMSKCFNLLPALVNAGMQPDNMNIHEIGIATDALVASQPSLKPGSADEGICKQINLSSTPDL